MNIERLQLELNAVMMVGPEMQPDWRYFKINNCLVNNNVSVISIDISCNINFCSEVCDNQENSVKNEMRYGVNIARKISFVDY